MKVKVIGKIENGGKLIFKQPVIKTLEANDIILHDGAYHRVIENGQKLQMVKI